MLFKRYIALILTIVLTFGCLGNVEIVFANDYFHTDNIVEVEDGSIDNKVLLVNAPYASGGAYCVVKSVSNTKPEQLTDEMSFTYEIEESGNYILFIRAYSKSAKNMYYRWDFGQWKSLDIPAGTDFSWIELEGETLKQGVHKLQFCHGQVDVYYDALYLTADGEYVPENPKGIEPMPLEVPPAVNIIQEQKKAISVDKNGIMIEAEDMMLSMNMAIGSGADASGGKYIYFNNSEVGTQPQNEAIPDVQLTFNVEEDGRYYIWARLYAGNGASDSTYFKMDDINWRYTEASIGDYKWLCLNAGMLISNTSAIPNFLDKGTHTVSFIHRESNFRIDQIVIASRPSYTPKDIVSDVVMEISEIDPISGYPPYNPPESVHPRLYFMEKDIPGLIEKYNHPENAVYKKVFDEYVNGALDVGSAYSEEKLHRVEAKAYYYALFGDEVVGRQAVEAALAMGNWTYSGNVTRTGGHGISTMSNVYDWCYDLMTEEERLEIIENCIARAQNMEIMWPPTGHGELTIDGHGAEAQILRDLLSFAIATYDERPDFWNFIGGRFYNEYVDERQWEVQAEIHHQGNAYGTYRLGWNLWAYMLITGMGLPEPYDGEKLAKFAYAQQIYARRPDGSMFLRGDMYDSDLMTHTHYDVGLLLKSVKMGKDPYLKDELMKLAFNVGADGITPKTLSEEGPTFWMIFSEPEIEAKPISNLSLSKYCPEPGGFAFARTGWNTGVESNTACAQLNIGYNYQLNGGHGGHDHFDVGDFQLYYKGPLATEGGYYVTYGHENHQVYYQSTTSHNCMLIYDPNEPVENYTRNVSFEPVNDGGQMVKRGGTHGLDIYANFVERPDIYKVSSVKGHEIDPKNPVEPDYTYLSGDLTNAYSDKVEDYKRSFMFLNFKDEEIPAALIVFDKVTSSNPEFKKTWLLHGQSYPEFSGNRSVWLSDEYTDAKGQSYSGKMVVDHLLPQNSEKNVVGGEDNWYVIGGKNIAHDDDAKARKSVKAEGEAYRLEISETGKETSYFLNCLQVTDEDNNSYLQTEMVDTNEFYGVKISDRAVLFSKNGEKVNSKFEITSNGRNYKWTICDVQDGNWKIIADGKEINVSVTEEGGVLSFETSAKNITAEPTAAVAESIQSEIVIEKQESIYVKVGSDIVGLPVEAKLLNGKLMVPVKALKYHMEISESKDFLKEIYYDSEQDIRVEIPIDANEIIVNGVAVKTVNSSYYEEDYLMVELRPFAESLNFKVFWDDINKNVLLHPEKKAADKSVIGMEKGYAKIISGTNDGGTITEGYGADNLFDNDLTTVWSCEGEGRFCTIELEEKTVLENVEILFNPSGERSQAFDIQISTDGENFETIYSGRGSFGCDGKTWEVFRFDDKINAEAKFVRYVGYGSNISGWNALREIRFKECDPIYRWADSEEFAKVIKTVGDKDNEKTNRQVSNINDNNHRTVWDTEGKGRYVDFELNEICEVSGVSLIFVPEAKRKQKFEIYVSEDGINFEKVYEGAETETSDGKTWAKFSFEKSINAKYVRYVGMGSNLNIKNGVTEIRILKAQ